ncbi:hypothetical protein V7161_22215 [Neobacillus drentensis]|uniref:hypothetical protein n=1 Tax=Neobacillus drentensis TaxID=220684 RepID=UPI003003727C
MDDNWRIEDLEQKLVLMEDQVSNFYKRRKGLLGTAKTNRKKLRKSSPIDQTGGSNTKEKIEEKKSALAKHNELYYFGPARTAVTLTREAIMDWEKGILEEALWKQQEACKHYNHLDFEFNLGKMYLESGIDYSEGLFHLYNYFIHTSDSDYCKAQLYDWLQIEKIEGGYKGLLSNHSIIIDFEFFREEMTYYGDDEVFQTDLPLPYKAPVSLDLERKDKETITMRDYWYLSELWDPKGEIGRTYEIKIHQNKFQSFIKEFYSTVIELTKEGSLKELTSFKKLKHQLFMYNLSKKYYHEGAFGEPVEVALPEDESIISILLITIPFENDEEFLDLFRKFSKEHLMNVKSNMEVDEENEDDEYWKQQAEYEAHQEKIDSFETFLKNAELFATLSVILDNLNNDVSDPYHTENTMVYEVAKEHYLQHLGDLFDDMKEEVEQQLHSSPKKKERTGKEKQLDLIDKILKKVDSEKIHQMLKENLYDAAELVNTRPKLALGPMRLTLEVLLQESCLKIGKSIREGDREKPLFVLINETKDVITREIDTFLYKIRTNANTALHYNALRGLISLNKNEVETLYSILLQVVDFYVIKFKL